MECVERGERDMSQGAQPPEVEGSGIGKRLELKARPTGGGVNCPRSQPFLPSDFQRCSQRGAGPNAPNQGPEIKEWAAKPVQRERGRGRGRERERERAGRGGQEREREKGRRRVLERRWRWAPVPPCAVVVTWDHRPSHRLHSFIYST